MRKKRSSTEGVDCAKSAVQGAISERVRLTQSASSSGVGPPSTYAAPPSTIPIVRSRGYQEPRCVHPAA